MSNIDKYLNSLASVLTNLPQAVLIVRPDLSVQYANEYAQEFFGYSEADLLRSRLDKLIDPKYQKNIGQKIDNLACDKEGLQGKNSTLVTAVLKKNGTSLLTNATLVQIKAQNGDTDILVRFDKIPDSINPQQVIERQIESASASSEIIHALDMLDDSVVIFDNNWCYQFVNAAGWRVLKKQPTEILGHCVWDVMPHLKNTAWKKTALEAMKTQTTLEIEEYYTASGRWYITKFYPATYSVVAMMKDVTELKEAKHINSQLMGTLEEAMEVYWSDENRVRRQKNKSL